MYYNSQQGKSMLGIYNSKDANLTFFLKYFNSVFWILIFKFIMSHFTMKSKSKVGFT